MNRDSLLINLFTRTRPDCELMFFTTCGIPAVELQLDLLIQEKRDLPIIHEYILKFLNHLSDRRLIASLLGIDSEIVSNAISRLINEGLVRSIDNSDKYTLTTHGRQVVEDGDYLPKYFGQKMYFNRITNKLMLNEKLNLMTRNVAKDLEWEIFEPQSKHKITDNQIDLNQIRRFFNTNTKSSFEILSLSKVAKASSTRFFEADLLVYRDKISGEPQPLIIIDSEADEEISSRLATNFRLSENIQQEVKEELILDPINSNINLAIAETIADDNTQIKGIETHECVIYFHQALREARERILIISPWVKNEVVDADFIRLLEDRLRKKVKIDIAWGYKDRRAVNDKFMLRGSHRAALKRLYDLKVKYSEFFDIYELMDTHAKVLIYDDIQVTPSFNWLSYRGNKTYRFEYGSVIKSRKFTDEQYYDLIKVKIPNLISSEPSKI